MPNVRLEQLHIDQFIGLLFNSKIPATYQKEPEPDFIIKPDGKVIGIEHTQLIRLPDSKGMNIMGHSRIADFIIRKAENLYKTLHNTCLKVTVDFRCDYGLNSQNPIQLHNTDIEELSRFITEFISQKLPIIEQAGHNSYFRYDAFDINIGSLVLPEKISQIHIFNTKNFQHPCWSASQSTFVPQFFGSIEFETILKKKNRKPINYKSKYDEIWLLLVEDSMDLTSYFDFDNSEVLAFKSSFDRTFILRRAENIFIELDTYKS